jgi:hypothetical protein
VSCSRGGGVHGLEGHRRLRGERPTHHLHPSTGRCASYLPRHPTAQAAIAHALDTPIGSSSGAASGGAEPSGPSTSTSTGAGATTRSAPPQRSSECNDSDDADDADAFVLIDRQDAVDALACFVAEALLKCPQVTT